MMIIQDDETLSSFKPSLFMNSVMDNFQFSETFILQCFDLKRLFEVDFK